jgi:hypothetical protein
MIECGLCEQRIYPDSDGKMRHSCSKLTSTRQQLAGTQPYKLGIYKGVSGKYGYSEFCNARNRVTPDRVWLDNKGAICVAIERRSEPQC